MHPALTFRAAVLTLLVAAGAPTPAQAPAPLAAIPGLQHDAVALQPHQQGLAGFGPAYSVRFIG